jgi:hypothetical protein
LPKVTIQIDGEGEGMATVLDAMANALRTSTSQRDIVVLPAEKEPEKPRLRSASTVGEISRQNKLPYYMDASKEVTKALSTVLTTEPFTGSAAELRTAVREVLNKSFKGDNILRSKLYMYCCPSQRPWKKALKANNLREENGMIVVL